uniref:Uncharacterized protein AlNc14C159G7722 n=1 Tax=Albugo laibachii Nc14 TaxID=890382 RepID=F0WMN4_9STRA|nr:conserved hypothetical protein [Albugo laibachii Nc14]|eukprot:CCA22568.1 conserved hypothetical protein [Albugo laibachii Nc14]
MSFRGELLRFDDDAFKMILSDAKLEINSQSHINKHSKAEMPTYRACGPRILISDYLTKKILEIFLLENVRMQTTTLSLLWVQSRKRNPNCYVFHFWSRIDFEEFSRLSDATKAMQNIQVLQKTILFELGWNAVRQQAHDKSQDGRTQSSFGKLLIETETSGTDVVGGYHDRVEISVQNKNVALQCDVLEQHGNLNECRSNSTMDCSTEKQKLMHVTLNQSSGKPTKTKMASYVSKSSMGTGVERSKDSKKQKKNCTTQKSTKKRNTPHTTKMSFLDYTTNYYKLILRREEAGLTCRESEDVCICCRDGGDVILCDWKGKNKLPCPKVYHEECLGYTVPKNVRWVCPRHLCHLCGEMARFLCRFCVSSYCDKHVTEDVRYIGPASKEVTECAYVLCNSCQEQAKHVHEAKRISSEVYASILGTQHRKSFSSRQRPRSRAPL